MSTTGQRALILGLAREGVSLASYLARQGMHVTVTDSAPEERLRERMDSLRDLPVDFVVGGDFPELVHAADAFFVSPGVPETNPVYQFAVSAGLAVQSMTTLFFDLCPGRIAAITGSSGKTTTTGLIGHILQSAGRDAVIGGNIGDPMLELLPQIGPETTVVLELSSFQLALLRRSPHLAVVTNISPNHLDRHGTMSEYIVAKRHIVEHQSADDLAILNATDAVVREFAAHTPAQVRWFGPSIPGEGAIICDGFICLLHAGRSTQVMSTAAIRLRGEHNVENVLAAVAACDFLGVSVADMAAAIATFEPAPHRLQTVAEVGGIQYIDDSIATSPARAVVALRALMEPVIVIAGGRDKHLPWQEWATEVVTRARAVVLIGEAAHLIEGAINLAIDTHHPPSPPDVLRAASLKDAVHAASMRARPGDVVLLSPGCTSYDMFSDFAERGAAFARAVEELYAA